MTAPTSMQGTQEDYGDLLLGLEDDDLNDFDGLDDFGDDIDVASQQMHARAANALAHGTADHTLPADPFSAGRIPKSTGFTTGNGTRVPSPSKAAVERARKLLQEDPEESGTPGVKAETVDLPNKRRKIDHPEEEEEEEEEEEIPDIPAPDFVMVESTGFVTGKGKAVPPPSKAALEKGMKIIQAVEEETISEEVEEKPVIPPTLLPGSKMSSFTTGGGNAVAGPSSAALAAVGKLFGDDGPSGSIPMADDAVMATPVKTSGFTTGSGVPATMASQAARQRVMAMFGEEDTESPSRPRTSMLPPTSTPFRPLVQATATPQRPTTISGTAPPFQSPVFRTPLRTTTNTCPSNPTSTLAKPMKVLKAIEIKTPAPASQRRVGLGRTPSSTRGKVKNTFSTPFKNPGKSSDSPLKSTTLRTSGMTPVPSGLSKGLAPSPAKVTSLPVFDLTKPPDRKNMKDAFLHPQYNSIAELQELGFPDEIWLLDLNNAGIYQFIAEDGKPLDRYHAFTTIKQGGCTLINQKWVDNHWSQILWKIAGQVQAKPALYDEKWNWGEVIAQLKYRYEREYGQAQRPIIRRIQEHDSSPSSPMILYVAAVHHPEAPADGEENAPPPRPYLELSDGWYKILAEVDDCLARAINKGTIRVGRKIAVSGAKLDSGSEGADVLEAFDKSRLIISGNSTSLARWHAKLGVQPEPFVVGLPSLSVDGGPIVLMDVVIEKLYPIAFISSVKGTREGPWNESEEQIRSDQWRDKYQAESTSLREKMRKQLESIEDLVETLCSAAQDVSDPVSSNPPDTLDRDFDILLSSTSASVKIRTMSNSNIVHLATYARERLQQEMADGNADIERELQTACPPREIRDFRMARIVDAREGDRDATRVGMLNIWEATSLGEGTLREGGRYLVSGLMAGRQGDWGAPSQGGGLKEIYLHTRRDTRWQEVGASV